MSLPLLSLHLLLGIGISTILPRSSTLFPKLPTPALTFLALHADAGRRSEALGALRSRIIADRSIRPELQSLVDALLARQTELSQPWDNTAGDFLETLDQRYLLSKAESDRFANGTYLLTIHSRTALHAGEPLACSATATFRGASADLPGKAAFSFDVYARDPILAVAGHGTPCIPAGDSGLMMGRNGQPFVFVAGSLPADLPPGKHSLVLRLETAVGDPLGSALFREPPPATRSFPLTVTVLPPEVPTVELVSDPASLAAARRACESFQVRVSRGIDLLVYDHYEMDSSGLDAAGIRAGFDITISAKGKTLRTLFFQASGATLIAGSASALTYDPQGYRSFPETVDVTFTPSRKVGLLHPDITRIPDLSFTLPNVRVLNGDGRPATTWQRSTPAPATSRSAPTATPR